MHKRFKKGFYITLVIGLLCIFVLGLVPINLFFAKSAIGEFAQQNLGIGLNIQGKISLRLGFNPELKATSLKVGIPGHDGRQLASIDQLVIKPAILDLLKDIQHFRSLHVTRMVVNYCPDRLPSAATEGDNSNPPVIAIDHLALESVELTCDEPARLNELIPETVRVVMQAPMGEPTQAQVSALIQGSKAELTITTANLNELLSGKTPLFVDALIQGFESRLHVEGEIQNHQEGPRLAAQLSIDSDDPSQLFAITGFEMAFTDPINIKAEVDAGLEDIQVKGLQGSLGLHQLSMNGSIRGFTTRPYFDLEFNFPQLDIGLFSGEATATQSVSPQAVTDFKPWLTHLQSFDGELTFKIGKLLNAPLAIENTRLSAQISNGRIVVDRSQLGLEDSLLSLKAIIDTNLDCPDISGELHWTDIDLARIAQLAATSIDVRGGVQSAVTTFRSCGFTLDDHTRSLQVQSNIETAEVLYGDMEFPLVVESLAVNTSFDSPGSLRLEGKFLSEHISGELNFGSLSQLTTDITLPHSLRMQGAGADLRAEGVLSFHGVDPKLDTRLVINTEQIGKLNRWFGVNPDSELALSTRGDLTLSLESWSSKMEMDLGQSDLRGTLSGTVEPSGLRLGMSLESSVLNIDELTRLFAESDQQVTSSVSSGEGSNQVKHPLAEYLLNLPAIDYDLSVRRIAGLDFDIQSLSATGRSQDRLVSEDTLEVTFEGIKVSGKLKLDLQKQPWLLDYSTHVGNLDIGRLLSKLDITDDIDARAEHSSIEIVSEGNSIAEMVSNARLESRFEQFRLKGDLIPDEFVEDTLHFPLVELKAAPRRKSEWSATGNLNGIPVRLWLQTPSLIQALDTASDTELRLALSADRDLALLDALVKREHDGVREIEFELSGQVIDQNDVVFSELVPPLNDYELRSHLTVGKERLHLSGLEARLGSTSLTGSVIIDNFDDRTGLKVQLQSPRFETDDFIYWLDDWRNADGIEAETVASANQEPKNPQGIIAIINRSLDQATADMSFDIGLEAETFYASGNLLGSARVHVFADKEQLAINPLQIDMPDGNVHLEYLVRNSETGASAGLKINMERLEYGGLIKLADPDSRASGVIYLDTDLSAVAPEWEQIPAHLSGNLDMLFIPDDIEAEFLDLWASNLVLMLLPTGKDEKKKLNCLVARYSVDKGIMKVKNMLLDSTDVIINGRGSIDLGKRTMDLLFAPQAKREKFFSVTAPIKVKGPFTDFQTGITTKGFAINAFKLYLSLLYVPYKWLTGERFPADGQVTCFNAMGWDAP